MNFITKTTTFLKEVKLEMKKVNWPNRQEVFKYTLAVILISFVVATFLGGFDFLFQFLINKFVL